jgi:putative acetyltransferase
VARDIRIRTEAAADVAAIDAVVRQAFKDELTAELVSLIRASPGYIPELSLVAEEEDMIVGHIMVSHLDLDDGERTHQVATLSPLSVRPDAQRNGVGSVLIRTALERADRHREPLIVLEGSPLYYPRFGFQPAKHVGITIHLPAWAPEAAAMVYPLSNYSPEIRGTVVYPPAFDRVNQDR